MCHDSAVAPATGAPEDEIEVTPVMIEAGLPYLYRFDQERSVEENLISELYRAMVLASTCLPSGRQSSR